MLQILLTPIKLLIFLIKILAWVLLLPFFLLHLGFKVKTNIFNKILIWLFSVVLMPVWLVFYLMGAVGVTRLGEDLGLITYHEYISGTGSMYPTFPKGEGKTNIEKMNEMVAKVPARKYPGGLVLLNNRYFSYDLKRGDIVTFTNQKTAEIIQKEASSSANPNTGFIKRLIGLPGDKIEIRNGFVYLNGAILDEPYTAAPRSTYGGPFLPDCKEITIPQNQVLVLGDNRKGSNDSRFEVGFVPLEDIDSVIPIDKQSSSPNTRDLLKVNWRETLNDHDSANQALLNTSEYLQLLNKKREQLGLKPLKYQKSLEHSAKIRAGVVIKYNDLSFEATRSGITMTKAMAQAGYSNIVWGEAPTLGFYTAEELIDNYLQFPETKKFLLNADYQETGIAAQVGEINGCPVQVVVQHLAGYIPPNYTQDEIQSWQKLIENINQVLPSWEKARDYQSINQADLEVLIGLMKLRRDNAQAILNQMKSNQWLTKEQNKLAEDDKVLFEKIDSLIQKLNSR